MSVRYNEEKARNSQADMLQQNLIEWKDKYMTAVEEIKRREQLYIEVLQKRRATVQGQD